MLLPKCKSCGKYIGNLQLLWEEELDKNSKILEDTNISYEDKSKITSKILDNLELRRWCCRTKILTYYKQIKVIR